MYNQRYIDELRKIFDPSPTPRMLFGKPWYFYDWETDFDLMMDEFDIYETYLKDELVKAIQNNDISWKYVEDLNKEIGLIQLKWKEFIYQETHDYDRDYE